MYIGFFYPGPTYYTKYVDFIIRRWNNNRRQKYKKKKNKRQCKMAKLQTLHNL